MKILLHDNQLHLRFAPLTLTKPLAELRMGVFTNTERWKVLLPNATFGFQTENYLQNLFPTIEDADIVVNAALIPDETVVDHILALKEGQTLFFKDEWLAKRGNGLEQKQYKGTAPIIINFRWDLFKLNDDVIKIDFQLLSKGRKSEKLSESNTLIGPIQNVFIEKGAKVEASIINVSNGYVYIGKDAEIMEGSIIRASLAMCEGSALKLGTKVYGATTLGPHCKVGGEVNNVVFQAYSNKGHDGFLGNALIGEWCNIGADTNASNLKNNYGEVSCYSYEHDEEMKTGEQFIGLCMGDHSKCGINTMFNTGTVVGISSNIYGADFPPKFIPSFRWGGAAHLETYRFDKAIESANNMMIRRGKTLSEEEILVLKHLFEHL